MSVFFDQTADSGEENVSFTRKKHQAELKISKPWLYFECLGGKRLKDRDNPFHEIPAESHHLLFLTSVF